MGFIADQFAKKDLPPGGDSRRVWREVFGNTTKEDGLKERRPVNGGSFGRSLVSSDASIKRLLQAMRSSAPGAWSDDRWEQTKHFTGIQYICIHRIGEQMAQSDFQIFEKDDSHPDGKRPVRKGHPGYQAYKILEKPNPDDSFGDLMYRWNQQMDLTGSALTWMVPNMLGLPMELYSIPTTVAIPQPVVNPDYPNGYYRIQPVYPYGPFSSYPTPSSAVGAAIPAEWMLRFLFPHPLLRYDGFAPLTALRQHIDEVEMVDRSRTYSMRRSIRPSAVLNMKEMEGVQGMPWEEIERIKAEFEADFEGPENHGRLYVSAPGSELEEFGRSPVDMDYQAGWEQLVSFVMAGLGITKSAAGMIEDSSYATLFATLKQLHLLTLKPKCDRIGAKLTRHLAPFYGDDLIIEVRCPRIDDHEVLERKISTLIQAKAITKNEVRKEMDMPVTEEEWGDEIAGTDSQEEQQQQGGEGGFMGGPMPNQGGKQEGKQGEQQQPPEVEKERPSTNTLGEGSLGPRKELLNGFFKKSAKSLILEAIGHE